MLRVTRLALLALLLVAAGCDEDTAEPVQTSEVASSAPGLCAEVATQFGHTLQGHATMNLVELFRVLYVLDEDGRLVGGDFQIGVALENACSSLACQPAPSDGSTSSFEGCLVAVEQALVSETNVDLSCGDGVCQDEEAATTNFDEDTGLFVSACPEDCSCGNGVCERHREENELTCELDCPAICGNESCTWNETCGEAPAERPWMSRCDVDCCTGSAGGTVCGDGVCDWQPPFDGAPSPETAQSCEEDCGAQRCGDGACLPPETATECPLDCGELVCHEAPSTAWPSCANGANCLNCPGGCADPLEVCGDGVCSGCEPWTCTVDCTAAAFALCTRDASGDLVCPPAHCGDGTCAGGVENPRTCPQDCAGTRDHVLSETCASDGLCDDVDRYRRCADCSGAATVCGDGYCEPGEGGSRVLDPGAWTQCEVDCGG